MPRCGSMDNGGMGEQDPIEKGVGAEKGKWLEVRRLGEQLGRMVFGAPHHERSRLAARR